MFINHTNHESAQWSRKQLSASAQYGEIRDFPFPAIPPERDEADIRAMVEKNAQEIAALKPNAVLCQGEYIYTFQMVEQLKSLGIPVLAACSRRVTLEIVDEYEHTQRESQFEFVRYREY